MKHIWILETPLHFGSTTQTVFYRMVKTDGHHQMPSACIIIARCHNTQPSGIFHPWIQIYDIVVAQVSNLIYLL